MKYSEFAALGQKIDAMSALLDELVEETNYDSPEDVAALRELEAELETLEAIHAAARANFEPKKPAPLTNAQISQMRHDTAETMSLLKDILRLIPECSTIYGANLPEDPVEV